MGKLLNAESIIGVVIVGELLLVPKLISVNQLFSVVPVLICEITVITVKTLRLENPASLTECVKIRKRLPI